MERTLRERAEAGFTLIETLVAMTLFSIGVMALTQVQFAAARNSTTSKLTSTASFLASDRLEEMMYGTPFAQITAANFPEEDYGGVQNGDERYRAFKRQVTVADSLDITGAVSMKTVTVRVAWRGLRGERNVELMSRVARF
jgi:prepilin-type N-terminal cleavage/methylation domain-containing protein